MLRFASPSYRKLENIMFESKHPDAAIKLIDFGLAARFGSSSGAMLGTSSVLKERVGTLYCMSPCVLLGKGYTSKAGMWSVGVIAYTMLSGGNHPFHGKTPKQVVARILQGEYSFGGDENDDSGDAWSHVSNDAKSFIRGLLRLEPKDRMSARQAIKHPWIQRQANRSMSSDESLFWQPVITEGVPSTNQQAGLNNPEAATGSASNEEWRHRVTSEMVKYAEWSDFRKLALNVIAKRSTSDEIFEIRRVFAEFDTENSGTITLDDFRSALTQYDPTYSDEELEDIFRKIDVGGTSVINYTEFLASALEARGSIEEWKLAEAFDMLDRDGSGCISKDDLRRVVGDQADDAYLDELIAQAGGSTTDGRISYPEFLRAFSDQTHDLVYGMYEASRSRNRLPGSEAASAGTDSILERRGLSIPRLVSVSARQRLASRRRWLAASAKSRLAGALQVLAPTTKDDVLTYISTGRPNPR
jgi:calcium-dependent protein kinase